MLMFQILKNGSVICSVVASDLADALRVAGLSPDSVDGIEMNTCIRGSDVFRARVTL